ncbi:MAG: hypothetical protein EA351_05795 [Gemmatimonadales bacterium]|nr:MAG: hypothetical protein EA351_05795 [Gemmatimonadales bacterium]
MYTGLLHAHSGLRYLVILAGIVALLYALYGVVTRRDYDKPMRITATAFAGLLHLQVLLGFILLVSADRFGTHLIGHMGLMLAAAAAVQIPLSVFRRRAPEQRTFLPHLVTIVLAMLLIWLGIRTMGIGLFETRGF